MPQPSQSNAVETYTVSRLKCGNCKWSQYDGIMKERHKIPKGQSVEETPCPACGCKKLRTGFA